MLFDTHTHTYFSELADRQDEVVASMQANNIRYATQIGCDIETSKQAIELARKYELFYATIGYHPTEGQVLIRENIPNVVRELEELLLANRKYIVAIGEIGFDYYHLEAGKESEQKETQKILFFAMTELAQKYNLPVVVHTRDAREDTLRYLEESGIRKAIIHCFSEDYTFAQELMEYSDEIYFSFSGIVTYKKSLAVQEAARLLPLSKILIETDAPFLSPQAVRGTINEPANVQYILDAIKNLRTESSTEIEKMIYENSLRIYKISN
ncbi:MAG: TatD family hydrolase [Candidatus Gracilibacteria bacterium]|nr:TatD family hydrolase [Candidatus Gracilibacteria bacterium]